MFLESCGTVVSGQQECLRSTRQIGNRTESRNDCRNPEMFESSCVTLLLGNTDRFDHLVTQNPAPHELSTGLLGGKSVD